MFDCAFLILMAHTLFYNILIHLNFFYICSNCKPSMHSFPLIAIQNTVFMIWVFLQLKPLNPDFIKEQSITNRDLFSLRENIPISN